MSAALMARRHGSLAVIGPLDIARDLVDTSTVTVTKTDEKKFVNQYEVVKDLGKGSFGKVKLVKHKDTGELFAIKVLNKAVLRKKRMGSRSMMQVESPYDEDDDVEDEIRIMKELDHPKLVKLFEVIDSEDYHKIFLRLEFLDGGQTMPTEGPTDPLPETVARQYFRDLIDALEYLHNKGIVHRDIKPENLLRTAAGGVKMADFGTGYRMEGGSDRLSRSAGTPAFTAPEACVEGEFGGIAADVWAAGVTLYMFTHGRCPFMASNLGGIYQTIRDEQPQISPALSSSCRDLLARILDKDPAKRITVADIKKHEWLHQS